MLRKLVFLPVALLGMSCLFAAVNINTANEHELTTLHGIGKVKAAAIVAHRQQNGAFQSKEEIKSVKGIGEKIYMKIENEITTGAASRADNVPAKKRVVRITEMAQTEGMGN